MRIHTNPFYLGLLGVFAFMALWYSGKCVYYYYKYETLTAQTHPAHIDWSVKTIPGKFYFFEEEYQVQAHYAYAIQEKTYQGFTVLTDTKYLNPWGAEQKIAALSKEPVPLWYNPRRPYDSTLQKYFPLKECISTALLWGLLFYFVWLGMYVKKYQG